jgi:hypothetical protein
LKVKIFFSFFLFNHGILPIFFFFFQELARLINHKLGVNHSKKASGPSTRKSILGGGASSGASIGGGNSGAMGGGGGGGGDKGGGGEKGAGAGYDLDGQPPPPPPIIGDGLEQWKDRMDEVQRKWEQGDVLTADVVASRKNPDYFVKVRWRVTMCGTYKHTPTTMIMVVLRMMVGGDNDDGGGVFGEAWLYACK